jgi:malate dehydrogenase (oxaloacetate-decarboxylating)(NADP+)
MIAMKKTLERAALEYHSTGKPGKVDVKSSKKCDTEYTLSLAYSPGVAAPCIEIAKNPKDVNKYTTRGNLVAVITNGTAVLGLGNIGPLAAKPVMEGKGVLFKQFAGIDVYDIELNANTADEFIAAVKALEPTFGGINLEDIAAPMCFEVEEKLKSLLKIPVFHDDQHGTAIISGAALLNACHLTKRKLSRIKVVFNGAGAAAIACAKIFLRLGVNKKNVILCDSSGVVYEGRTSGMNPYKAEFASDTKARTLEEALVDADVFCGLSVANALSENMIMGMAKNPIIFAMANPDPEILPEVAKKIRPDCIVATGRSDYPNQVNNVLGFPSIFRGALDVEATSINEEMKLAAVHALADLARQDVPDSVSRAYSNKTFSFGPDYIIPKPFDPRVLMTVAPAVAKAAMESKVATKPITDLKAYRDHLESLGSASRSFVRGVINRIHVNSKKFKNEPPIVIFPEGSSSKVLKAVASVQPEGIIRPVLLGYPEQIKEKIRELELEDNFKDVPMIHMSSHKHFKKYVDAFYDERKRKGILYAEAERLIANPYYFSAMAVKMGDAHALVSGSQNTYANCVRPILQIIGPGRSGVASGMNMVLFEDRLIFFADTTVNIDPSAEDLAAIAVHVAKVARYFGLEPKVAMLSYTNFTAETASPKKMRDAARILKETQPNIIVDGEMQADTAVNGDIMERIFPFSSIKGGANILMFPNLDSSNISYKLLQQLGGGEVLGPFLLGVRKPANVLQRTCTVNEIINTIALTALEAQAFMENE